MRRNGRQLATPMRKKKKAEPLVSQGPDLSAGRRLAWRIFDCSIQFSYPSGGGSPMGAPPLSRLPRNLTVRAVTS